MICASFQAAHGPHSFSQASLAHNCECVCVCVCVCVCGKSEWGCMTTALFLSLSVCVVSFKLLVIQKK